MPLHHCRISITTQTRSAGPKCATSHLWTLCGAPSGHRRDGYKQVQVKFEVAEGQQQKTRGWCDFDARARRQVVHCGADDDEGNWKQMTRCQGKVATAGKV
ncbi:hypothetical protein EYF80_043538 [Liparis tanakae]|uniref:Uncharacterized protein n=1 Tax=Liparis tanakae TaxID=230148 RepID=A0A4Z2FY81_9TELE|nr:hypothetical protein EYF80_043538 [Liparis tanakae]